MSIVTIKLAPQEVCREFYFAKNRIGLVRANKDFYTPCPPFFSSRDGTNAAEDAFDLSNNPYRQEERMDVIGSVRSLSVGDIVEVEVNGKYDEFLCDSFGWIKL